MTKDDKEFLKEFLNGFLIICGVVAVFLILAYFLSSGTKIQPNERFQIVEKYNQCDIIRYIPDNSARYSYFLDCPK